MIILKFIHNHQLEYGFTILFSLIIPIVFPQAFHSYTELQRKNTFVEKFKDIAKITIGSVLVVTALILTFTLIRGSNSAMFGVILSIIIWALIKIKYANRK